MCEVLEKASYIISEPKHQNECKIPLKQHSIGQMGRGKVLVRIESINFQNQDHLLSLGRMITPNEGEVLGNALVIREDP